MQMTDNDIWAVTSALKSVGKHSLPTNMLRPFVVKGLRLLNMLFVFLGHDIVFSIRMKFLWKKAGFEI